MIKILKKTIKRIIAEIEIIIKTKDIVEKNLLKKIKLINMKIKNQKKIDIKVENKEVIQVKVLHQEAQVVLVAQDDIFKIYFYNLNLFFILILKIFK